MLEAVLELIRGEPGEQHPPALLQLPPAPCPPPAPLRAAAPPGRALSRSPSCARITAEARSRHSGNLLSRWLTGASGRFVLQVQQQNPAISAVIEDQRIWDFFLVTHVN